MSMRRVKVMPVGITALITEDCAILTVIESRDGKRPPTYETKEHDSFIDAIEYLGGESSIMSGDWDRVYIVNPGEAVPGEH